jgi:hypothetical protein
LRDASPRGSISGDNEEGDGIGGLIGYNDSGTISESYSEADMAGQFSVGGLVGRNKAISTLHALGNISGYSYIGGLVGFDIGERVISLVIVTQQELSAEMTILAGWLEMLSL